MSERVPIPIDSSIPYYERTYDESIRFKHCEIQINTACDLDCFGCDRFSDVITDPNMTVKQVDLFVKESIDLDWKWERIRLLGGEPTLHPRFVEMVELLFQYRERFPNVFLQVLSNGRGKLDNYREWLTNHGVDPHVEAKDPGVTPLWFNNTRITPVDRNPSVGELPPCGIFGEHGCGIALTRHGYFLDGAGASVARVAGIDVGVMALRDVTWKSMHEQAKVLCRLCGHWNPTDGTMVSEPITKTGETTGPWWQENIARFKKSKPIMKLYGDGSS